MAEDEFAVAPERFALTLREQRETRMIVGENVSVDDVIETVNSFELFDAMIDGLAEPITADLMKRYHRILMFQQCLQNGIMPFIVLDSQKMFYYRGLSESESEPGFLRETLRSMQDAYYARFEKFVPRG
jgi:hypothetical protein